MNGAPFTTHGTPLVRYRIGDRIKLAPKSFRCACGSSFPVVEYIDGRTSDFIWSPENGKVNLGNISNCTKDVDGIICFQVMQKEAHAVHIAVVANARFTRDQQQNFIDAMTLRLGTSVTVQLDLVDEIPREPSGKFRLVKNMLTSDLMQSASMQRS